MKRFCMLALVLALLVPALAMAAGLPSMPSYDKLSFHGNANSMGNAGFGYPILKDNGESYTVNYSLTGDVINYTYNFSCGCHVSYFPDGTILDVIRSAESSCTQNHAAPFTTSVNEPSRPPENILDMTTGYSSFSALKAYLSTGIDTLDNNNGYTYNPNTGSFTLNRAPDCNVLFVDGQYMSLEEGAAITIGTNLPTDRIPMLMIKGEKAALYEGPKLRQVYVGSILYNVRNDILRIYNDGQYSTRVFADYDVETGDLTHYGIHTKDHTLKTVYGVNNDLWTHEYWAKDGTYWNYFEGQWFYSTTGEYDENMVPGTPTTEVLDAVVLAPTPVTYFFGLSASKTSLPTDQPTIIGGTTATGGSTPQVTSDALSSRTTEYKLELVGNTTQLQEGVYVALPLNAGVTKSLLDSTLDLTIEHNGDVYSTMDGSIELQEGLAIIYTESFSPFVMTWGPDGTLKSGSSPAPSASSASSASSMPSTGDESNLMLFAALLVISAGAFIAFRRRAHQ